MNFAELLARIPVPVIALAISANLIPYLSALATKTAGWWTGAVTVALSVLGAVLAAVAQGGDQDWRYVAATALITWVVARLHLNTFIKQTEVEAWLHGNGNAAGRRPAAQQPPAQ